MLKSPIWFVGLLLFLITNSRFAASSAILENRPTDIPNEEETETHIDESSTEIIEQKIEPTEVPHPETPNGEESEPSGLVGEYYDAPEATEQVEEPEYGVANSKPESVEVATNYDGEYEQKGSIEKSTILTTLLEQSKEASVEKSDAEEQEIAEEDTLTDATATEPEIVEEPENFVHFVPTETPLPDSELIDPLCIEVAEHGILEEESPTATSVFEPKLMDEQEESTPTDETISPELEIADEISLTEGASLEPEAASEPTPIETISEQGTYAEQSREQDTVPVILVNTQENAGDGEHTDESLEEPDSTEVGIQNEINAIVASMATKTDMDKPEPTDAALEENGEESSETIIATPEESSSKEITAMDPEELVQEDDPRVAYATNGENTENIVIVLEEDRNEDVDDSASVETNLEGSEVVADETSMLSKLITIFSTQSTPEEQKSAESVLEGSPSDEPVIEDPSLLSRVLSIFSTQPTLEEPNPPEGSGDNSPVMEISSAEGVVLVENSSADGAPEEDESSEKTIVAVVSSNEAILSAEGGDLKDSELADTPSEIVEEPTVADEIVEEQVVVVASASSSEVESAEENATGNDVANTVSIVASAESGHHAIVNVSFEEEKSSESDATLNPVIFVADEKSVEIGSGSGSGKNIEYMESKITITFVNDGDDYADDPSDGAINLRLVATDDDDSEETIPSPGEEDDDGAAVAIVVKSSSSESDENNPDSRAESNSAESEETLTLELPKPTSEIGSMSTDTPPAAETDDNSSADKSDEKVDITVAPETEDDTAAATEDNGEKDASVEDEVTADEGNAGMVIDDGDLENAASLPGFDHKAMFISGVLVCLSFIELSVVF